MADEDIIFSLKLEPGDAFTEMERFKKGILETKQQQQELTKAYKAGHITLDEFVKEQVRMEAILKRQQSSYNNLQKSVTGVKTQLDKLIDSNKKISKSFQDAAGQINVAGVNIGGLTTKLAGFLNPATAAAAAVGLLGTAYANSAVGAEDLRKAQNLINASMDEFSNKVGNASRKGFWANLTLENAAQRWKEFTVAMTSNTKEERADRENRIAIAKVELNTIQELEVERIFAAANAKKREKEAEEERRKRDNSQLTFNQRLQAAALVTEKLTGLETEQVGIINKQVRALLSYGENVGSITEGTLKEYDLTKKINFENVTALEQKKVLALLMQEIEDKHEMVSGKLTENVMAERAITAEKLKQQGVDPRKVTMQVPKGTESDAREEARQFQEFILGVELNTADKQIETHAMTEEEKTEATRMGEANRLALAEEAAKARLMVASSLFEGLAGLADEGTALQKTLALASIGIDTAQAISALVKYASQNPLNSVTFGIAGAVQYATHLAVILGNMASAKQYLSGFADGGWTGPGGKYEAAGIVHADEYVAPKHIVHSAAAQPHLAALESMRLRGYADGGLVVNSMTADVHQNMMMENMMKNMMKNMPRPIVQVVDINRAQQSVEVKQRLARSGSGIKK